MASPVLYSSSTFRGHLGTGTPDSTTYLRGDGSWQLITGIYNASSVAITGGTINGTTIGGTTAAAGTFTTLTSTGNTVLGDATTDTLTVGSTGLIKDSSNNVKVGNLLGVGRDPVNNYSIATALSIFVNPGTNITPDANWSGQVTATGSGYNGGLALDATGMWIGHNSAFRVLIFAINETEVARINTSGSFLITAGGGLGYGTGSGGSVTQLTSKSTGVTLNKTNGQIIMNNAALADATTVSFTVTNSTVASTDCVIVNHDSVGTLGGYIVQANNIGTGSFQISVRNVSGGSLSEAIVLNFAVIKAVTS